MDHATTTNPFVLVTAQALAGIGQYRPYAAQLGICDETTYDASIDAEKAQRLLRDAFDVRVLLHAPAVPNHGNVRGLVQEAESGVRYAAPEWTLWLRQLNGYVGAHDLLREAGMLVQMAVEQATGERSSGRYDLEKTLGPMRTIVGDVELTRENTPGYYVAAAGFLVRDEKRGYANRAAGAFCSLALALLWKLDTRLVFMDVLNHATSQDDVVMGRLFTRFACSSGVMMTDQKELQTWAASMFRLNTKEHWQNIAKVARLAQYFARSMRIERSRV